MSPGTLTVALAQISPVWLDREATVKKVADWIDQAADRGAKLVAFGETLLPGYPHWLGHTGGAEFDSKVQKELHAHYLDQAVDLDAGHLEIVSERAKEHGIHVMVGCFERPGDRGGHTGYCSLVSIDAAGLIQNVHRKIMPTYEERLSWGTGDGHGLRVFPVGPFKVGGLNCWENWIPLLRTALYGQGENLHVAVWPGSPRLTRDITRFMALEGRSFVLSVSGVLRREDIPESVPHRELILASVPDVLASGGSCIAAPTGEWIIDPADDQEQLLVAELSLRTVYEERQNFDPAGHYSRPDVVQLYVNRDRQSILAEEPEADE
ncbi:MAG: carbon-nitrogen hydrolase family protein [Gemmatimonadetes bacterium]|nr:carbon-nitrogen hydrolase family protein [Gemmatimonadota bacterium]NNM04705.1 carbon-nitrogen hydrolase family protein [Gemmatimonadota bacterium]